MGNTDPEQRVRAYIRLCQLDAPPSVTFDVNESSLYAKLSIEVYNKDEKDRKAEIDTNRKILGLAPA